MYTRITIFLISLSLLACSATNEEAGTGVPELDTTEAGVATGALIGAGVGALIGSTAGEAGAGVVLGSIAGATSGGIIGNAIEGQEKRIDQHDSRSGLNTKKVASSRGSLADTIWSTPGAAATANNNLPSGNKGRAAKYVSQTAETRIASTTKFSNSGTNSTFTQVKQERNVPAMPKTVAAITKPTTQSTFISRNENSGLPEAKTPTIELRKPKPELPTFNSAPIRKPSLNETSSNSKSTRFITPPVADSKNIIVAKESSRAKLAEPAPKQNIPQKQNIIVNKGSSNASDVKEEINANLNSKIEVAKIAAPAKTASVPSVCENGQKDLERAKKSASDSDKVFYLRRVILACPKDTASRVQLGQVYSRLGLKDEAKKEFTTVLDSEPENEAAQDEMSIMMLDSRKN